MVIRVTVFQPEFSLQGAHTVRLQRTQCPTIMRWAVILTGPNVLGKSGIAVPARFLFLQVCL